MVTKMKFDAELMKKVLEEKKKKALNPKNKKRGEKVIGEAAKGKRSKNGGGLFDR